MIEDCDYYILLIGSRRGGLYSGEDKSITQKEYEKAIKKQKSIKNLVAFGGFLRAEPLTAPSRRRRFAAQCLRSQFALSLTPFARTARDKYVRAA